MVDFVATLYRQSLVKITFVIGGQLPKDCQKQIYKYHIREIRKQYWVDKDGSVLLIKTELWSNSALWIQPCE